MEPIDLARRQLRRDREKTSRFDGLFEHKLDRMKPSALAFLRGTAPLYYDALRAMPWLASGPSGSGWLVGDLHLENFGVYRTERLGDHEPRSKARPTSRRRDVAFDINDFDEAAEGPWRWDVLRLLVSVLLSARDFGVSGSRTRELGRALLESHRLGLAEGSRRPPPPRPVAAMLSASSRRTAGDLLAGRTGSRGGKLQFVRGERYRDLGKGLEKAARLAFERYASRAEKNENVAGERLEILDLALRVAGTGSLGCLRIAVLTRGKGREDRSWMFEMKEEDARPSAAAVRDEPTPRSPGGAGGGAPPPKAAALADPPAEKGARRVVAAIEACLESPPRLLGLTTLGRSSMLVRRLAPEEDKLDSSRLVPADLLPLAGFLGTLSGQAHRRGATRPPKGPWSDAELAEVLQRGVVLAGIYEAAYLAYLDLAAKAGCKGSPQSARGVGTGLGSSCVDE